MSELRDKVKEIAEIAASVPENLQQSCFEILLRQYLGSLGQPPGSAQGAPAENAPIPPPDLPPGSPAVEEAGRVQTDLAVGDLHVKTRRFMEKYGVTLEELNNLFYKEDQVIQPLYEDVKTTRLSEAQVRIALLQSLRNALTTGEFSSPVETVRAECRDRKSYDSANFAANFKNNQSLFDDKYTKETTTLRLSEDGRKELSQLVKELQ